VCANSIRSSCSLGLRRGFVFVLLGFHRFAEAVALSVDLEDVPIGRMGKLVTVDRREIESLLALRAVMEEYLNQSLSAPLSLAVFGPPGSGKSFAVEQVAESLPSSKCSVLKFNLTQMSGETDLFGAFHQVRDRALSGKTPLGLLG